MVNSQAGLMDGETYFATIGADIPLVYVEIVGAATATFGAV